MKAYELRNDSGTITLAMVERPQTAPAAGEVLVRMRATSLNYRDLMISKAPAHRAAGSAVRRCG